MLAATDGSGIPVRDPGQASPGGREPALVGVEVPVTVIRDPRESAERRERAASQPS